MGGDASTAKPEKQKGAPHCSEKQVPKRLGITRKLPWHRRVPEDDGAAPVTVKLAGAEEDNTEKTL